MSLPFLSDSSLASRIFVDLLEGLMRPLGKLTLVLVADLSLPLHVSVSGGFLGGPNAAIGQVDIGWWPICHSHSMCQYLGDFLEGLICPIVTPTPPLTSRRLGLLHPISDCYLVCSPFPQTCQPVLGSHQVLHSPQDGLVCFILFPPATLFAHPFPRPVSQCLAPIKSSAHLKMAWFASSHLRPPPRSPTLPAQGSSTWQAGWQVDS